MLIKCLSVYHYSRSSLFYLSAAIRLVSSVLLDMNPEQFFFFLYARLHLSHTFVQGVPRYFLFLSISILSKYINELIILIFNKNSLLKI